MPRKLFAVALFAVASAAMMYASSTAEAVDEAPAPRPAGVGAGDEKKPDAKGKFGGFGGFNKGGFGGKLDPEKFKELKEKFGDKFGKNGFGGFGGGKIDPEKLKEIKGKFGKEGGFPFPGGKGGFGKKKDDNEK